MKPTYNNWMPKLMVNSLKIAAIICLIGFIITACMRFFLHYSSALIVGLYLFFACLFALFTLLFRRFSYMRRMFSYDDADSLAWQIINYTADSIELDQPKAKILDVGCGSGALSITMAKRYKEAKVIGIDYWGMSYKGSFSKQICEDNAKAEQVDNVVFSSGDAKKLDFADETFDAVVSNYVYHNISGDRQALLRESLRTLKKGGTFAIHDLFTKNKYPQLDAFIEELKANDYSKVELIDTTKGQPMTPDLAKKTLLTGSKLLCGIK